jgi:Spy/CpxP family protein refolding chaperone
MRPFQFASLFLLASSFSFAAGKDAPNQDPIVWGRMSGNASCVIFAEGHKTKGMFWGVAVTTQTTGKLTVIETQNYTLDQEEYLETQDVMNDLMRRAQKDNVKFVKIPEKYPPELLEKARTACKPDA